MIRRESRPRDAAPGSVYLLLGIAGRLGASSRSVSLIGIVCNVALLWGRSRALDDCRALLLAHHRT